jgi:hypothetical protein
MSTNGKRRKLKGRRVTGSFILFPWAVYDSRNHLAASSHARRALLDLSRQFNGGNNGDLALTWKIARKLGWRSRDTLYNALTELEHFGLIERTRQGGLNLPNLYALTWRAIDDCKGKLDCAPTSVPSNEWNKARGPFPRVGKQTGQHAIRVNATRLPGQPRSKRDVH